MKEDKGHSNFELLDHLPFGSCVLDKDHIVLFWNDFIEHLTEVPKEAIVGFKLNKFFPHFGNKLYVNRLENIFTGGAPVIFSSHLHKSIFNPLDKHAERVQRTVVTAIPGPNKKDYYALFSIEDVTEHSNKIKQYRELKEIAVKEVERREIIEKELMIGKEDLKESIATKDKFFSIIAHDLKGPLSSMLGLSKLLIDNFDEFDTFQKKEFITHIYDSTERNYKLLDNLLTWSQSQTGTIDFRPAKENIYLIIDDTIKLLFHSAENKSIKLTNKISSELYVLADKDMFLTIIRNLLSNAIKFTATGGEVSIQEDLFTKNKNKKFAKITIKDNGEGISKIIQSKLFEIAGNISTKGTENESGTGLGLVLCKEFVEKQGGEIWVESEEGKGSKFIFTLPIFEEKL